MNISYRDKEWLKQRIITDGWSQQQVADHCGVAKATIADWCMKLRVVKKNYPKKTKRVYTANTSKLQDTKWLKYHYVELGWSYSKIAEHLGVGKTTVSKAIQNNPEINQRPSTIELKGTGLRVVQCIVCGEEVKRKKARAENQDWFSCSDKCFYKHLKKIVKSEENIKRLQEGNKEWQKTDEGKEHAKRRGVLGVLAMASISETSIEKKLREFLETLNVNFEPQHPLGYFVVDFYLPDHNLVIECYGDYWHHNPITMKTTPSDKIKKNLKRDKSKKTYLTNRNYNLIILWENDINNSFENCKNQILKAIQE